MSRVQVLLQRDSLKFPETPEASRLAARVPYEIRFGKEANDRYAAFRVEAHDDLVTALGLAVPQKGASASTSVFPLHCAPTSCSEESSSEQRSKLDVSLRAGTGRVFDERNRMLEVVRFDHPEPGQWDICRGVGTFSSSCMTVPRSDRRCGS